MALAERHRKQLRRLGHARKPVVMVGAQGLRASVIDEIDAALAHHELIKVRVSADDRAARDALIGEIVAATGAELVQRVGHVALLFRRNPERPRVALG